MTIISFKVWRRLVLSIQNEIVFLIPIICKINNFITVIVNDPDKSQSSFFILRSYFKIIK